MTRRKKGAPAESARYLAARLVGQWFDALTSSIRATSADYEWMHGPDLFVEAHQLEAAVKAELLADHPGIEWTDVEEGTCIREAAYLIGVQVGLRLRGGAAVQDRERREREQ